MPPSTSGFSAPKGTLGSKIARMRVCQQKKAEGKGESEGDQEWWPDVGYILLRFVMTRSGPKVRSTKGSMTVGETMFYKATVAHYTPHYTSLRDNTNKNPM